MHERNIHSEPEPGWPIGVFDSGLGGLSVLREVCALMPREDIVYFADNLHLPYGPRPLAEVRGFCVAIAGKLIDHPVKAVVVACNTASAASLKHLRALYPKTPFIGMEPAVKPAAADSKARKVGVLATQATFQGELFESVVERFAGDTQVLCQPCPGLAEFIESHPPDHPVLRHLLEKFIRPLLERGVDNIVLACTHYPLVKQTIQEIAGPGVTVVDPSPAIARRTRQVLESLGLENARGTGDVRFLVSGEINGFSASASLILDRDVRAEAAAFRWVPVADSDYSPFSSD